MNAIEITVGIDTPRGLIISDIVMQRDDIHTHISRQVIQTEDVGVRRALHNLGWHHESEQQSMLIPNHPTKEDPQGSGFHRVTVADVQKLERKLRRIAADLNR